MGSFFVFKRISRQPTSKIIIVTRRMVEWQEEKIFVLMVVLVGLLMWGVALKRQVSAENSEEAVAQGDVVKIGISQLRASRPG